MVGQTVARRVQHVPCRTDERRRRKPSRPVGLEEWGNRLAGVFCQHRIHRVGNVRGVLRLRQANGAVCVVHQFRVEENEERVQPRGVPRPVHGVVVHTHWGVDHQIVHGVSKHRTQPVVVVDHVHVQAVRGQTLRDCRMCFHSQGVPGQRIVVARAVRAAAVVLGGRGMEVARHHVHASKHLFVVTHPVAVGIGFTAATAHTQGIHLVALAIAIAQRQEITSTLVHRTWAVANATFIQVSEARVDVVANAIHVQIQRALSTAHAHLVQLVAFAIAVALGDGVTPAVVGRTRAVAHAALVHDAHAVVFVVTHPVAVRIRGAVAAAHAQRVELVPVAIAVAGWDVGASTFKDSTRATAHTTLVKLVAIAVAVAVWQGVTTTFVDVARTVANAACVDLAHTVIHVVTHPVAVRVRSTAAAAHAQGVVVQTAAVVRVCCSVVVARRRIRAAFHNRNTAAVVVLRFGVVVEGRGVRATASLDRARLREHALAVKVNRHPDVRAGHAELEDLGVHRARNGAGRAHLHEQHTLVCACGGVRRVARHKPRSAGHRVREQ